VAPPHPDVEGSNPETKGEDGEPVAVPPVVEAATDELKEKSAEVEEKKAKPGSEGSEATFVL